MLTQTQLERIKGIGELSLEAFSDDSFEQIIVQKLERLLEATGGVFFNMQGDLQNPHFGKASYHNVDPYYGDNYSDYYHQMDPCMTQLLTQQKLAPVSTLQAINSVDSYVQSEYYNDFLRPQKIHTSMIFMLTGETGLLGLAGFQRPKNKDSFSTDEQMIAALVSPYLVHALEKRDLAGGNQAHRIGDVDLTQRQWDIIQMVARGLTNNQIANRLNVSVKTVEHHLTNIYRRTHLHNRVGLARLIKN